MGNRDWFITLKTQKCCNYCYLTEKKQKKLVHTFASLWQEKKHIKYQSSSYFDPTSTLKMLDR